jgi:hypothetical protein
MQSPRVGWPTGDQGHAHSGGGEPVNEGGGQMGVFEEGTPVGKAEVGSQERGFFLMPLVHQGKEEPDLDWFDLDVADLIEKC